MEADQWLCEGRMEAGQWLCERSRDMSQWPSPAATRAWVSTDGGSEGS